MSNFKYSIENFRGVAILFVMLSHISSLANFGNLGAIAYFILTDATTWFVFISGYLFTLTHSDRKFKYISYLKSKAKYVLSPFLFLSVLTISAGFYLNRDLLLGLNEYQYILWSLVVGGSVVSPLWFIPTFVLYFLCSFIFIKFKDDLFFLITTTVLLIFALFSDRPFYNANPLMAGIHFLGFYVFGMYLFLVNEKIQLINSNYSIKIISIFLIFFMIVIIIYFNLPKPEHRTFKEKIGLLNYHQLGKFFLLMALFLFFEKFYNVKNKYLSYLAENSFGLFFIHGFYMSIFSRLDFPPKTPEIVSLLVETFMIVVLSIVTIHYSKKILKKRSRYVIGC